jgi:hypothetical protein
MQWLSRKEVGMKIFIYAALLLFVPSCCWAATDAKTCVLKATAALPKIVGLRIKKSGVRTMPSEQLANWKGQSKPIVVDLDTDAPVASERYSYICASSPSGTTFVQRILN